MIFSLGESEYSYKNEKGLNIWNNSILWEYSSSSKLNDINEYYCNIPSSKIVIAGNCNINDDFKNDKLKDNIISLKKTEKQKQFIKNYYNGQNNNLVDENVIKSTFLTLFAAYLKIMMKISIIKYY